MPLSRRMLIAGLSGSLPLLILPRAASAKTVVKVSLWDKGEASMDNVESMLPMGMAMAGADMHMATMGITATVTEIPAGEVRFDVTNDSQEFYHSMVISPVGDVTKELPYLADTMMVDEEAAGIVAKGKELKPHAAGSLAVELSPGQYILYCNVAGHYMMGMWTLVTAVG